MRLIRFSAMVFATIFAAVALPAVVLAQTVLRYSDHEPLGGMRPNFLKEVFFAAIEKESGGRLKITDQWDSKVSTGYDALRVVGAGEKAAMGMVVPEYSDKELPLHQIFKGFPAGPAGARQVEFFRRAFAEIPAFAAELKQNNVVPIFLATGYPVAFFGTRPLENLANIRDQKWRTASFWHRDFLRNAGANPVSIPWGPGVFDALKARTLDGLMVNIDSGVMLKVHETAPHVLASRDLWLGHLYIVAMNAGVWERLAQEDREAIGRAADGAYRALGAVMDRSYAAMVADLAKVGVTVRQLEGAEVSAFENAARATEVQAAWAKAAEGRGVAEAGRIMEQVRVLIDSHRR